MPHAGFHPQLLCAFESAALHNTRRNVVVLMDIRSPMERFHGFGRITKEKRNYNSAINHLRLLLGLAPRLSFAKVDFRTVVDGTPAEVQGQKMFDVNFC